jgi:CO/xanthine dehydrogenase Mo-binding subunit
VEDAMTGSAAIGVERPRPDAVPKVRGATRFGADEAVAGLLHLRPVLAARAHARIVSIERDAARAVPGVVDVLIAEDLPIAKPSPDRLGEPLARSEVVFAGQPVAVVVARTREAAADAAELVTVRLDPLPVVLDPEAAMRPGSPLARSDLEAGAEDAGAEASVHAGSVAEGDRSIEAEELSPNVVGRYRHDAGDVAAALAGAAAVVRGRFTTSWVHQGYLEPQVTTAWLDVTGELVLETATQGIFSVRNAVADTLGLPAHRVRLRGTPPGGAFGGKWGLFETLVGGVALRLRRPVRLVLERREDMLATNPGQAFAVEAELGAAADGRFVGLRARVVADAGADAESSMESFAAVLLAGPYHWPTFDIRAYGVLTNRVGVGSYRGPGAPQTAFALETLLDELAAELRLDPIELRRRNAAPEGSRRVDGDPWTRIGLAEVLDGLAAAPAWRDRADRPDGEGIGVAVGCWPGAQNSAAAICRASPDGTFQVLTGVVDLTGVTGAFEAITAEVLRVPVDAIQIVTLDTAAAPPSPGTGGSTVTYSAGRAIRLAAEDVAGQLLEAASRELEIAVADLELADGTVRPRGTPERAISVASLVRSANRARRAPFEGHGRSDKPSEAPSVAGVVVRVRVDRATGQVAILESHVVQDVGRALNPALVREQQHGATVQSLGWAVREALVHDANGQLLTASFLDYGMLRADDAGRLGNQLVEVPAPDGPFGAKGIGEAPIIPGLAAVANAIADATGVRLRDLPMSPSRVWRALSA